MALARWMSVGGKECFTFKMQGYEAISQSSPMVSLLSQSLSTLPCVLPVLDGEGTIKG